MGSSGSAKGGRTGRRLRARGDARGFDVDDDGEDGGWTRDNESGDMKACQPWKEKKGSSRSESGVDGGEGKRTRRDGRTRRMWELGGAEEMGLGLVAGFNGGAGTFDEIEEVVGIAFGGAREGGGGGRSIGEMTTSVSWERRRAGDFDEGDGTSNSTGNQREWSARSGAAREKGENASLPTRILILFLPFTHISKIWFSAQTRTWKRRFCSR